jgi:hypothetical protein
VIGTYRPVELILQPQQHYALAFRADVGVNCRVCAAWALWYLGYPEQALHMTQEALAQELAHPFSRAFALHYAARLHQCRQEGGATQHQAEAALMLFTEQGVALYAAFSRILRGWGLAARGHGVEGMAQMRQGLTAYQATGAKLTHRHTDFACHINKMLIYPL